MCTVRTDEFRKDAVRREVAERLLTALPAWNGRNVIDGTNPVAFLAEGSPERKDPLAASSIKASDLGGVPSADKQATITLGIERGFPIYAFSDNRLIDKTDVSDATAGAPSTAAAIHFAPSSNSSRQ